MSRTDASTRTIGYAVVGLGWISQAAMLPAFANVRHNSRLVALVSGDAAKRRTLAERYHLDPDHDTYEYNGLEDCLDRDDVDAVYIALPNHLHREYTERAAARGVHVLCEKPMAVTDDDCLAMIDACDRAGVRLMIAYRLHLDPVNLEVVSRIQDGVIGEPRLFSAAFTQQVSDGDVRLMPPEKGGGPLYDIGVYCINAARYLFRAEPEAVWATRVSRDQPRFHHIAEAISGVLRFPGQRLASFTCSFGAHPVGFYHVVGDQGDLRLENGFHFTGERRLGDETYPEHDQFGAQVAYFSDCIANHRPPEPDGEEGRVDVRIIRALYDSMANGRMVELDLHRDRRPTPDMAASYPAVDAPELIEVEEPSG